jgi:DNA (cytosine-5)-methyltransferase 1
MMRETSNGPLPGSGIRVASFFSGGGGLDLGFEALGFETVFANDVEPVFCKTLAWNRGTYISPNAEILCKDIRYLDRASLPERIDLVIGGPPCQTFSASGRRAGGAAGRLDSRGTLFEAYCALLAKIEPKAFVFENVRGILGTNGGRDWNEIVAHFARLGYQLSFRILDACDYGIPQHRERLILVGHRLSSEFLFPMPTHGPDSKNGIPHISPREAFAGIQETENLAALKLDSGKYAALLPLVPPGGNYLFFTAKRGYSQPIFAYRSRFSDFLYKANPDSPIKTLIASPGKYTGPFHWENRCFSIAEYKRLQGFPDDYNFAGSRAEVIAQIGNSVSPKIAEALARSIADQIFSRPAELDLMPVRFRLSFDRRKSATAQRTRENHRAVARNGVAKSPFELQSYRAFVTPYTGTERENVDTLSSHNEVQLTVRADDSDRLFVKMQLAIAPSQPELFDSLNEHALATVNVMLFGSSPHSVQTMWNAVDDWVIRSSSFHSLYELYGHFTEPHPVFSITKFKVFLRHPIARFAAHAAKFENCSRYFPRRHLLKIFGKSFRTKRFTELVRILRGYRFDIRCHETNIAIPTGVYMVAYPFTLPHRRQMNFSVNQSRARGASI